MKWHCDIIVAALAAALFAGCAAPDPGDRLRSELQSGGEFYLSVSAAPLRDHLARNFYAVERGVAESELPGRETKQSVLALLRAAGSFAGIREIAAFGASSVREADGAFSNRAAVVSGGAADGWIWKIAGASEPRLARLGELPAETVFAVDFGIELKPVVDELSAGEFGSSMNKKREELFMMSPAELLNALSGDWRITIAAPENCAWDDVEKYDLHISLPDRGGALASRLSALLPVLMPGARRNENTIYLPESAGGASVLVLEKERILFFSSRRCFERFGGTGTKDSAPGKKLADTPRFAAACGRLPASSHGAYFFDTSHLNRDLRLGGEKGMVLKLDSDNSFAVGSWRAERGMVASREIASAEFTVKTFELLAETPLLMLADSLLRPEEKPAPRQPSPNAEKKPSPRGNRRAEVAACESRLKKIHGALADYAAKHNGEFPPDSVLKSRCGNGEYVYFGPFPKKPSAKYPLVVDPPVGNAHPGVFNVLFADGTIGSFEFSADNLKRLCSFLHTVYRYDEQELVRLIERASQLDSRRTKKR